MTEQFVPAGDAELCIETYGGPNDPAVLLIGGAASSMDWWDPEFCNRIAEHGRFVIRYDHRDTGRSTASPPGKPAYSTLDLATDPLRILDALGIERAHLVGISMGAGITQLLAALHPQRVASITLCSTGPAGERTGTQELPKPDPRISALFADPPPEPDWNDRAAVIDYVVEGNRPYAGSLGFDAEEVRRVAGIVVDRTPDIATQANHWIVPGSAPSFRMSDIAVPALVMHGTDDPFFPPPHGEVLAAEIAGATFLPLPGMGHEVPPRPLWDVVVPAIVEHTGR